MNKWLYFSWGILYALSAVLGLVQDPSETQKLLMLIFSLTFFVPGFLLLYNAIQAGNRKGVLTVRLISLASLVLTTGGLVAMLLSAGTGSEVNRYSVLTIGEKKLSFSTPDTLPRVAFLDPRYLRTLGREGTVSTALDAFCHCLESYLSPKSTPASESM